MPAASAQQMPPCVLCKGQQAGSRGQASLPPSCDPGRCRGLEGASWPAPTGLQETHRVVSHRGSLWWGGLQCARTGGSGPLRHVVAGMRPQVPTTSRTPRMRPGGQEWGGRAILRQSRLVVELALSAQMPSFPGQSGGGLWLGVRHPGSSLPPAGSGLGKSARGSLHSPGWAAQPPSGAKWSFRAWPSSVQVVVVWSGVSVAGLPPSGTCPPGVLGPPLRGPARLDLQKGRLVGRLRQQRGWVCRRAPLARHRTGSLPCLQCSPNRWEEAELTFGAFPGAAGAIRRNSPLTCAVGGGLERGPRGGPPPVNFVEGAVAGRG